MQLIENEYRVFGPPGCGKTTFMQQRIAHEAKTNGSDGIIVASFTKTAAAELTGRKLPLEQNQIGTLHSHCYRAIGHGTVTDDHLEEWNAYAPVHRLGSAKKQNIDELAVDIVHETRGDALRAQYDIFRARMTQRDMWPADVIHFATKWETWKKETGYIDFTDMIEIALHDTTAPTQSARIGFFDEAQDFTRLELTLIRHWAKSMDQVIIAGDDDQTIYDFCGATPDAFLDPPVADKQKYVLSQSYRVPHSIQTYAQNWIEQVQRREAKIYKPRNEEGLITQFDAKYVDVDQIINDAESYLSSGKTVMFLTTCSYMLDPLIMTLRQRGIPFHNPYRRSRGDWNPLHAGHGTRATDRILAFLRPENSIWGEEARMWNGEDLDAWASVLKSDGILMHGAKTTIAKLPPFDEVDISWMLEHMHEEAINHAIDGNLDWFYQNILPSKQKSMTFPYMIAKQHGASLLRETPRITVGTIHSVKGGQADVVYLFPDLSKGAMQQWITRGSGHDAIIRQFYVGMTRAKETLIICQPRSAFAINLPNPREVANAA